MKHNVANFIIHDLSTKYRADESLGVNSTVISDVVEGWNRKIYVVPYQAVKLNRQEPEKYILM